MIQLSTMFKYDQITYQSGEHISSVCVNSSQGYVTYSKRKKNQSKQELLKMDYQGFVFHIINNSFERVSLKYQKELFVFAYEGQGKVKINGFQLDNITLSNNFNRKEFHQTLYSLFNSDLVNENISFENMMKAILT